MVQFDGIPEFILTAQLQSFTAVATQLGVTSSAVGKAVSRLETRLEVKLLHRTTRKLTLTQEGDAYLASCLRVLETRQLYRVVGEFNADKSTTFRQQQRIEIGPRIIGNVIETA